MRIPILFSILIALLSLTYYYEEVPQQRDDLDKEKEQPFSFLQMSDFKKEDLVSVRIGKIQLQRRENGFYVLTPSGPIPADHTILENVFNKLSQIRLERVLLPKERQGLSRELFFRTPDEKIIFEFKGGSISYQLGEKLDLSGSFYLNLVKDGKESWLVAYDDGPGLELMPNGVEDERSPERYQSMKSLFYLPADNFILKKVFVAPTDLVEAGPVMRMNFEHDRTHGLELFFDDEQVKVKQSQLKGPLNEASFKQLFQLLLGRANLGPQVEVMALSPEEEKMEMKRESPSLHLHFKNSKGQQISLYLAMNNNHQLFITHLQARFVLRYTLRTDEHFPLLEKDYFPTRILGN